MFCYNNKIINNHHNLINNSNFINNNNLKNSKDRIFKMILMMVLIIKIMNHHFHKIEQLLEILVETLNIDINQVFFFIIKKKKIIQYTIKYR